MVIQYAPLLLRAAVGAPPQTHATLQGESLPRRGAAPKATAKTAPKPAVAPTDADAGVAGRACHVDPITGEHHWCAAVDAGADTIAGAAAEDEPMDGDSPPSAATSPSSAVHICVMTEFEEGRRSVAPITSHLHLSLVILVIHQLRR